MKLDAKRVHDNDDPIDNELLSLTSIFQVNIDQHQHQQLKNLTEFSSKPKDSTKLRPVQDVWIIYDPNHVITVNY